MVITLEKFLMLSEEERYDAYKDLSSKDRFWVRIQGSAISSRGLTKEERDAYNEYVERIFKEMQFEYNQQEKAKNKL